MVPILVALLLGTLMSSLSQLIVTTALPLVVAALGGMDLYSWAFAASLLTSTIVVPIAGKLSDLYGRRTIYLVGMAVFILGSALSGAAQSIGQLILFRGIQGLGAGCISPSVSALIADLFPPDRRGRWQGINGAVWGLSSIVGPILGGYLAEHVSWRWVFYVNLFPGIIAALLIARFLPKETRGVQGLAVDYAGMALMSGALMALMMLSMFGGRAFPWGSAPALGLVGLFAALVTGFIWQERRAQEPILPVVLLRNQTYQTVLILAVLSGAGLFCAVTYVPLYLQAVLGVSATATGLLFLPTVVAMAATSAIAGMFMHRIGYRRLTFLTMAAGAIGFLFLATLGAETDVVPVMIGLSVVGGGIGLSFPIFIVMAQNAVDRSVVGVATATVQLSRSLGGTVGIALLGAYMTAQLAEVLVPGGPREVTSLLRPEALAALATSDVAYLRTELANAIRGLFTAGAIVLGASVLLTWRIRVPSGTVRP
jgi:EmrB/QacA subfamily drug resistance transporter